MFKIIRTLMTALLVTMTAVVWAGPVDINKADAETLAAELTGVGADKAAAIVAYRESNGPFASAEELTAVKGIGDKTLEKNRDNILVTSKKK